MVLTLAEGHFHTQACKTYVQLEDNLTHRSTDTPIQIAVFKSPARLRGKTTYFPCSIEQTMTKESLITCLDLVGIQTLGEIFQGSYRNNFLLWVFMVLFCIRYRVEAGHRGDDRKNQHFCPKWNFRFIHAFGNILTLQGFVLILLSIDRLLHYPLLFPHRDHRVLWTRDSRM